jgi:hypothetical protein
MLYNIQCLNNGFHYSSQLDYCIVFFILLLWRTFSLLKHMQPMKADVTKLIQRFCENMSQFILNLFINTNVIKLVKGDLIEGTG